ncbi:Cap15 family cyclic dinucleotide receptor domain-containing protein [Dyella flagellata]|uniref:CD-NTase-associated protein 15 domain-containing protein n=1 Tax=Dyella flagellata TaxID=1867833 RepID=A0ABQ5X7Z2_9GAMM|nr:hypothetical protein [Dyella flagellata]GLQ87710.1 hypothetical protein GCM10007898_12770 [Dyella flagellata]
MINLLPFNRLVTWIAIGYAGALLLAAVISGSPLNFHVVLRNGTTLYLVLMLVTSVGWKYIWKKFPSLNQRFFPLLEGEWDMTIHWRQGQKCGVAKAKATIKQTFLAISMEVSADDSDSETLMAQPKKDAESGRPILYYVYRVTPKLKTEKSPAPYLGSAILRFFPANGVGQLKGNYFTSARTDGHFELSRPA